MGFVFILLFHFLFQGVYFIILFRDRTTQEAGGEGRTLAGRKMPLRSRITIYHSTAWREHELLFRTIVCTRSETWPKTPKMGVFEWPLIHEFCYNKLQRNCLKCTVRFLYGPCGK